MFDTEDQIGTQDGYDDNYDDSQSDEQGTPEQDGGDEPFLVVDERTQYKTREEALKGFKNAGERIAGLSAWEKEMKQFGVKTPEQARQLMSELADRRQKELAAKSAPENQGKSKDATISDEDLSDADKAALKWLQKMAPRVGYVPREELKALKDELEQFKQGQQQSSQQVQDERFNDLVDSGRNELKSLMTAAKLPVNDVRAATAIENFVRAYIDADQSGERVERFYKGGSQLKALMSEAFDEFKYVHGIATAQKTTNYAADKNKAIARNGKPLPTNGSSNRGRQPQRGQQQQQNQKKTGLTAEVHNRAWEVFQKATRGSSDE